MFRAIRVLHLIEALGMGGAERRLMNDLKYLDRNRFFNVVCSLSPNVEMWEACLSDVPLYTFNVKKITEILKNLPRINRIIKKHNIDIIHTQLFWADLVGRLCKLLNKKVKLITTVQSTAYENNHPYLYSYKRKIVDSLSGRLLNDGYIAVSDYVKKICMDKLNFNSDKIRVIYNSVDLDYEVSLTKIKYLKDEFKIKPNQKTLITVGRIDPPKGHVYLIKALLEIREFIPDIKLLIVGDGPTKEDLINECRNLGLTQNIIFTGKRKDVKEILSICDIFIFPTLSEGLSVALLESMATKVACIATSIGPNREIIKHKENGILVNCKNVKEIVEAVLYLFNHPEEMKRISYRGFLTARERFSARSSAKNLEDYYMEILKS